MNIYERYKDSGIPWLGEIPEHWNICRLKDEVTFNDEVLGDKTDADYEILYVDISSVSLIEGIVQKEPMSFEDSPSRARRIVKNGDVIVSTVRTYLKAITQIQDAEDNLIVSTGFAVLRPRENLFPRFLGYWVQSENMIGAIVSNSVGVSYPAINATDLVRLPIVKLPLKEQTAIAHYLDTKLGEIDALIEKQQTLLEKLAEQRTAVITHAVTKGLNPAAPMKMSGVEWLGDVPAHWEVKRLKFLITELRVGPFGSAIKISDYVQDGKPLYNQRTVLDNSFANNSIFLTDEKYKELNSFQTKSGDFLLTTRGTIGKVAIVPQNAEPGIIHPCLIRFKIDENLFQPKLLKSIFNETDFFKKQLDLQSNATTIDVIYSNSLKELFLTLPPRDEQAVIADYLDQETTKIDRLCDTVNQTIGRLKEYRTALITQAVTGKIKVTDE